MSAAPLHFQHEAALQGLTDIATGVCRVSDLGAAHTERRGMVPRLPSPRGPSVDLANWPAQRRTSHE